MRRVARDLDLALVSRDHARRGMLLFHEPMVWVSSAQFDVWARDPLPIAVYESASLARRGAIVRRLAAVETLPGFGEDELLRRLQARGREDEAAIQRRFAEAKREINLLLGSSLVEEKSYQPYA